MEVNQSSARGMGVPKETTGDKCQERQGKGGGGGVKILAEQTVLPECMSVECSRIPGAQRKEPT